MNSEARKRPKTTLSEFSHAFLRWPKFWGQNLTFSAYGLPILGTGWGLHAISGNIFTIFPGLIY
jgi:hypothetical protein